MRLVSSTHADSIAGIARRACWGLLILVHLPPLVRVVLGLLEAPDGGRLLALAGLVLSVALFALKLVDVPWLRFGGGRGTALAFLLACSVVHHDVALSDAGRAIARDTPALVAVLLTVEAARRVALFGPQAWRALASWAAQCALVLRPCGMLGAALNAAPEIFFHLRQRPPRAPPV